MAKRRRYSEEFKRAAVGLTHQPSAIRLACVQNHLEPDFKATQPKTG